MCAVIIGAGRHNPSFVVRGVHVVDDLFGRGREERPKAPLSVALKVAPLVVRPIVLTAGQEVGPIRRSTYVRGPFDCRQVVELVRRLRP